MSFAFQLVRFILVVVWSLENLACKQTLQIKIGCFECECQFDKLPISNTKCCCLVFIFYVHYKTHATKYSGCNAVLRYYILDECQWIDSVSIDNAVVIRSFDSSNVLFLFLIWMRFYVCVCKLSALCDDRITNICSVMTAPRIFALIDRSHERTAHYGLELHTV